jgi:hypothetical protein
MAARQRRSPRLAVDLPIRVFGMDPQGAEFVEDSHTLAVSKHGAKIQLHHQLIPDHEIKIVCLETHQEAVFRVVAKASAAAPSHTLWGIECLNPAHDIWGVDTPPPGPEDQRSVRVMLECPECRTRELFFVEESRLEPIRDFGGVVRECRACGSTGIWKPVPYYES